MVVVCSERMGMYSLAKKPLMGSRLAVFHQTIYRPVVDSDLDRVSLLLFKRVRALENLLVTSSETARLSIWISLLCDNLLY